MAYFRGQKFVLDGDEIDVLCALLDFCRLLLFKANARACQSPCKPQPDVLGLHKLKHRSFVVAWRFGHWLADPRHQ